MLERESTEPAMIHTSIRLVNTRLANAAAMSLLACLVMFPSLLLGQMVSVTWEVDTTFYAPAPLTGSLPGTPAYNFDEEDLLNGYTTYKVFANFTNPTDKLVSVYSTGVGADVTAPLVLNASCGCYNTPIFGVFYGQNLNPFFFPTVPELEFDSYMTFDDVGVLATPNISSVYNNITGFCDMFVDDGAFVLNGGAGQVCGADLQIELFQITTCGSFEFHACFQVFPNGSQAAADIQFFCLEEEGGMLQVDPPCEDWAATDASVEVLYEIDCFGDLAAVEIQPAGGTASDITYQLFNAADTTLIATQTGNNQFGGILEGEYFVALTDGNTCRDTTASFAFVEPPAFEVSFTLESDNLCPGEYISVVHMEVAGGTEPWDFIAYSTTNLGIGTEPNGQFDWIGLPCINGDGEYEFTAEDANGCQVDTVIELNCPAALTFDLETEDVSCFGAGDGSVSGVVTGGTGGLTWSSNPEIGEAVGVSPLVVNFPSLEPGDYEATVTDQNGCSASTNFEITTPQPVTTEVLSTDLGCAGQCNGTVVQNAAGGTGPFEFIVTTLTGAGANPNALCAGTYLANTIDANNCVVQDTVVISEPPPIEFEVVVSNVSCAGQADGSICVVGATGGNGELLYQVDPPEDPFVNTPCFDLPVGTYTINVTDESNCTVSVAGLTLIEPEPMQLILNTDEISCFGFDDGAVQVSAIGGTGEIEMISPVATTLPYTIEGLGAGQTAIEIQDESGCTLQSMINLVEPDPLTLEALSTQNIACGGDCNGSAVLDFEGGTGTVSLTLNGSTNFNLNALCAGEYEALVTDANGCETLTLFTIDAPPTLEVLMAVSDVTCTGMNDGAANIFPVGGTGVLSWEVFPEGIDLDNLYEGEYAVTVVDAIGCVADTTFNVGAEEITDMSVVMLSSPVTCWNESDGTATASVTGGYFPIEFLWSDPDAQANATAIGLPEDVYSVVITDSLGCTITSTVEVEPTVGCLFIAEAVTPNGDGYNDEWIVGGLEYFPSARVTVFNRYGQVLFESQGYATRWDGRYNNAPLPMADYYYTIEFANGNAPITGTVTLKY